MSLFRFSNEQTFQIGETTIAGRVDYYGWIFNVIAWDGLLPVAVWLVPTVITLLFPRLRGAVEMTAVALPIAAFFVRYFVARRRIHSNHCTRVVRWAQLAVLCVAIFALVLIDAFIILTRIAPAGVMLGGGGDLITAVVLIALYLTCMAFVMYPGRAGEEPAVDPRNLDPFRDRGSAME